MTESCSLSWNETVSKPPVGHRPDLRVVEARALRRLFGIAVLLVTAITLIFLLIAFTQGH